MTKLELLNVFLNDRLTAAAEEIFRAVKSTVVEYQSEILRSKEENERLKRLLNVAVQRLLQQPGEDEDEEQQPDSHSVQPQDDDQPCELEWRSSVELLPQIKEEPKLKNSQTACSQEGSSSEEGNCSHVEPLQRSHPPPAQTVCSRQSVSPPPLTSQEVKAERDREDSRKQQQPANSLPSSMTVHSNCRAAQSDSRPGTAKSLRTQKTEQQVRGLIRTSGKQSAHLLQIKNVRSLKLPPPRSSHPGQSIQRWHSCKECGKGFSFACQLEVHMRWHTKEKPYSCAVCRKSFTTVSMLKRHHRIHTGEKPFHCHVCGKCFNQSAHLNTHFRLHTRERAGWSRATLSK
ncbi:zinc finger and SCAN domain-containing protein 22-like isoform X2 [Sebastes umbrosus]|uniref:zinc finger and SCAN domain-containing protein 22-like isoform X2 n=1 Tax=Sebastes umbrosus TaxID=72105 RepID=UPI00189F895A|nr:zinc finger and SCAN domain-containing protein 22-like isoform X2 [Sebastes umbrosus]